MIRTAVVSRMFVWLWFVVLAAPGVRAAGNPVLLEQLTRPPMLAAVSMSSDGHFLAALARK
ncbi:MAG: hypothetical protein EP335_05595, partial [Alphaproteobacteria bacterium]